MPVSAHDVARELRSRMPDVGVVKLHKLLYYAQGWHLAMYDTALFAEPIEAWTNGPVVAELWADEKHDRGIPPQRPLDGMAVDVLDYVIERYGRHSGRDLIRRTHQEDPWLDISESDDPVAVDRPVISNHALRSWFEQDDEWLDRCATVEKLRARQDVYGFGPLEPSTELAAAVERARTGQRVRHHRPG